MADVDANKVTLEWSKPRNDGGKRVNGYVVEYKPLNSTEWEQAAIVKDLTATGKFLRLPSSNLKHINYLSIN